MHNKDPHDEALAEFTPELRSRLGSQADTIIVELLKHREGPQVSSVREEVHFSRGTAWFALLLMHTSADQLVAFLDRAAIQRTPKEARWRVSRRDHTIGRAHIDSVPIALHPEGIDVASLQSVPDNVRLFVLERLAPYDVWKTAPYDAKTIRKQRQNLEEDLLRSNWHNHQKRECLERLITTLQEELRRQHSNLSPAVAQNLQGLLHDASRARDFNLALQLAGYLGVLPQITAGFGKR